MTDATRYDHVQYPAGLYPTTTPDHLAMISTLHGLTAPAPDTARVLEIAGGDGVNLIAMAAAYPRASFLSFDLAPAAVQRGQSLARSAGLANVQVEVGDVIEAAESMAGEFDYVIAHGLYSWVPEAVRMATMRLIGRVLAPEGIAFVSYNALPGGYLRMAVRDMLLHQVRELEDPEARVAGARAVLRDFAAPRPTDRPVLAALRQIAEPMLAKNAGTLFHDELGDDYFPQSLADVVSAASPYGLSFLNDAMPPMIYDGLPGTDSSDAEVVHAAQADDYNVLAFFHQTLLIRGSRAPARRLDPAAFESLYAASPVRRTGQTSFARGDASFEIDDPDLADFVEALGECWPRRLSTASSASNADRGEALIRLYHAEILSLHSMPSPGVEPGERPRASPLARAQLAAGADLLFTLDHRTMAFVEPGPRTFLALLDGDCDRARLHAAWAASGYGEQVSVDDALAQLARAGMLVG